MDSVGFWSVPLHSIDFVTNGFWSGFRQKSSDKFRTTPIRNSSKIDGTDWKLSEKIRTGIR